MSFVSIIYSIVFFLATGNHGNRDVCDVADDGNEAEESEECRGEVEEYEADEICYDADDEQDGDDNEVDDDGVDVLHCVFLSCCVGLFCLPFRHHEYYAPIVRVSTTFFKFF